MSQKRNKIILLIIAIILGIFIVFMIIKTYQYKQTISTDYSNDQYVQYGKKCLDLASNSDFALCRISNSHNKISLINLKAVPPNAQGRIFIVVNTPKIIMNSNTKSNLNPDTVTMYCLDFSPSFKKILSLQSKNVFIPRNSNFPDTILPAGHSICGGSIPKSAIVMVPFATNKVKPWQFIMTSISRRNSNKIPWASYQRDIVWQLTI